MPDTGLKKNDSTNYIVFFVVESPEEISSLFSSSEAEKGTELVQLNSLPDSLDVGKKWSFKLFDFIVFLHLQHVSK